MLKPCSITMLAFIATVSAAPYLPPLSAFPAYSPAFNPAYTQPILPGAVSAFSPAYSPAYSQPILPGAVSAPLAAPVSAAYPRADLAAYAFGEYGYGVPNYTPLASAYSLPAAYTYEYVYGR